MCTSKSGVVPLIYTRIIIQYKFVVCSHFYLLFLEIKCRLTCPDYRVSLVGKVSFMKPGYC